MTKQIKLKSASIRRRLLILLGLVLIFMVWTFWPMPPVKIITSRETTYLTDYQTEHGLTDYASYLNQLNGKGVLPKDNACAWLLKMIDEDQLNVKVKDALWLFKSDPLRQKVLDHDIQMMLEAMDLPDVAIVPFLEWDKFIVAQSSKVTSESKSNEQALADYAAYIEKSKTDFQMPYGVWQAKDHPLAVKYLAQTRKSFNLFRRASRCDTFYLPILQLREDHTKPGIHLGKFWLINFVRQVSTAIEIQINLNIGEGNLDAATHDALAIVRMGRLLTRMKGGASIDYLVGRSIEAQGVSALHRVIHAEGFNQAHAKLMREEIGQLKPAVSRAHVFGNADRMQTLNMLEFIGTGSIDLKLLSPAAASINTPNLENNDRIIVDINPVLIAVNQAYDKELSAKPRDQMQMKTTDFGAYYQWVKSLAGLPRR